MKKRTLFLVVGLCVLMLAGGCTKKAPTKNAEKKTETDSKVTSEVAKPKKEAYKEGDYVTLGQYKGVKVTVTKLEVTEESINTKIKDIMNPNPMQMATTPEPTPAMEKVKDRTKVKNGDWANIDFKGLKDGVAFEGGTGTNFNLLIGSHSFVDDFEEQLVGKKVGDKVDVKVTFPENYGSADLAGKDAVFKVTINAINKVSDAYKKQIKAQLEEENKKKMESEKKANLVGEIIKNSKFSSVPESLTKYYTEVYQYPYKMQAQQQNTELKKLLEQNGVTEAQFNEVSKSYAEAYAKNELVLDAIVKAEKLELTDEEFKKEMKEYLTYYGFKTEEEFFKSNGITEKDAKDEMLRNKAVEFVLKESVEA